MKKTLAISAISMAIAATGAHATCTTTANQTLSDRQYQVINSSSTKIYYRHGYIDGKEINFDQDTQELSSDMDGSKGDQNSQTKEYSEAHGNDQMNVICAVTNSGKLTPLGCCQNAKLDFEGLTVRFTDGKQKTKLKVAKMSGSKENGNSATYY